MDSTILMYAVGGLVALVVLSVVVFLLTKSKAAPKTAEITKESLEKRATEDVDHIFNDEFREELRNMGRLHFQKVVNDNAMFLKEDLRLTSSQLNEFLKAEVTKHLQDSFQGYDQSLGDAKQLAIDAVERITSSLEIQRSELTTKLEEDVAAQKAQMIEQFQTRMADVVNHYLLSAVGNQIDLNAQLDYILGEMKQNQKAMAEDINQ